MEVRVWLGWIQHAGGDRQGNRVWGKGASHDGSRELQGGSLRSEAEAVFLELNHELL